MTIQIQPFDVDAFLMVLLVNSLLQTPAYKGEKPDLVARQAYEYLKGIRKVLERERGTDD